MRFTRTWALTTTYLYDPCRRLLFTPQYPLSANNACIWVYRAVDDVDGDHMRAVWVGILVPHADDDVVPWVAVEHVGENEAVRWIQTRSALTRSGTAERNNACLTERTNGCEERIGAGIRG